MSRDLALALLPMAVLAAAALATPLALSEPEAAAAALHALDVQEHGNLVLPLEAGARAATLPPLLAWLQAASAALFGLGGVALRLPGALAALGLAWIVHALAEERLGGGAGRVAAWMLASCPLVAAALTSPAPDLALAATVALSLLGLFRAEQGRGGAAPFHLGFALSFLCKGPVGPLLVVVACALVARNAAGRSALRVLWGSAWSAVLFAPALWLLLAYAVGESIFLDDAVGLFVGTLRGDAGQPGGPGALRSLLVGGAPWSWLGAAGVGAALLGGGSARTPALVLVGTTAAVALSRTQRPVYVLPLLPLACVLAAALLEQLARSPGARRRLRAAACLGAGGLVAYHAIGLVGSRGGDPDAALRELAGVVAEADRGGARVALYGPVPHAFRFYARRNVPARSDPELGWFFAAARPGRTALLVTTTRQLPALRERFGPRLALRAEEPGSEPGRLAVLEWVPDEASGSAPAR